MARYQPVDRNAEAAALLARRREWLVGRVDGQIVFALVPRRSRAGVFYRVRLTDLVCDCKDASYGNVCAHSRAVAFAKAIKRRQRYAAGQGA